MFQPWAIIRIEFWCIISSPYISNLNKSIVMMAQGRNIDKNTVVFDRYFSLGPSSGSVRKMYSKTLQRSFKWFDSSLRFVQLLSFPAVALRFGQVYFQCPVEVAVARNRLRHSLVTQQTIEQMSTRLEAPGARSWETAVGVCDATQPACEMCVP